MASPIGRPRSRTTSSRKKYRSSTGADNITRHSFQSESNMGRQFDSSPIIRRSTSGVAMHMRPIAELANRPHWTPGAEPGLDPLKENGGLGSLPTGKNTRCTITAVDFTQDEMSQYSLDNESLPGYLEEPRDGKSTCRWINVNGLSWDVMSALGKAYNLSPLALEDMVNIRNRTKADWYNKHLFIILKLQRLVALDPVTPSDTSEGSSGSSTSGSFVEKIRQVISSNKTPDSLPTVERKTPNIAELKDRHLDLNGEPYRTLQEYHGGENQERVEYLEQHSLLKEQHRQIIVEQVAIFVTSDNVIISFFESSAREIEAPILRRLRSPTTMIRGAVDATMVTQALIDGVIDLALPINNAFKNAIDQMELDVLTEKPDKEYTNLLYILKSEMTAMKNLISPITKMIQTLRNHRLSTIKFEMENSAGATRNPRSTSTTIVKISEITHIYLGDVEDHCILMEEQLNQMLNSAGEISDLIFNTLNIDTNDTMKKLTIATLTSIPFTCSAGYFGMNFVPFTLLKKGVAYFWWITIPLVVATAIYLNWDDLMSLFPGKKQRGILNRQRLLREKMKFEMGGRLND